MPSRAQNKLRLSGIAMLLVLSLIVVLTGTLFTRAFTPTVPVTVRTDKAGLLMSAGSDVKLRGVVVGKVGSITRENGGTALIHLDLAPEHVDRIPANIGAMVDPTTLFGRKSVALVEPESPSTQPVAAGAVLTSEQEVPEVSATFDELVGLLEAVQPAKLNSALGAVAETLDGRGEVLGEYAVQLRDYLRALRPSLPTLADDLALSDDVVDAYADAAPDLLATAENSSTTGKTVVEQQLALDALLLDITTFGRSGESLLAENGQNIVQVLDMFDPATQLISRYSPMFPCFFGGLEETRKLAKRMIGGEKPGLNAHGSVEAGIVPYDGAQDLPEVGVTSGPDCRGLPKLEGDELPAPGREYDDGVESRRSDSNTLGSMLFGAGSEGP